jgi:hypothetical protein
MSGWSTMIKCGIFCDCIDLRGQAGLVRQSARKPPAVLQNAAEPAPCILVSFTQEED